MPAIQTLVSFTDLIMALTQLLEPGRQPRIYLRFIHLGNFRWLTCSPGVVART